MTTTKVTSANMGLAKAGLQCLNEHLYFLIATFAKPENVSGKFVRED